MSARASIAFSNDRRVFSGKFPEAPRCATFMKPAMRARAWTVPAPRRSWKASLQLSSIREVDEKLLVAFGTQQRRFGHAGDPITDRHGSILDLFNYTDMLLARSDHPAFSYFSF